MDAECLFCKMCTGEIPTDKLYEDEELLAFRDINPVAPLHFLLIPKKHIAGPAAITEDDELLIGRLMKKGAEIAKANGHDNFRFVVNNGAEAGQTVFHLHLHVIAGRNLTWPPG